MCLLKGHFVIPNIALSPILLFTAHGLTQNWFLISVYFSLGSLLSLPPYASRLFILFLLLISVQAFHLQCVLPGPTG